MICSVIFSHRLKNSSSRGEIKSSSFKEGPSGLDLCLCVLTLPPFWFCLWDQGPLGVIRLLSVYVQGGEGAQSWLCTRFQPGSETLLSFVTFSESCEGIPSIKPGEGTKVQWLQFCVTQKSTCMFFMQKHVTFWEHYSGQAGATRSCWLWEDKPTFFKHPSN